MQVGRPGSGHEASLGGGGPEWPCRRPTPGCRSPIALSLRATVNCQPLPSRGGFIRFQRLPGFVLQQKYLAGVTA